jgi:hypothetical protein
MLRNTAILLALVATIEARATVIFSDGQSHVLSSGTTINDGVVIGSGSSLTIEAGASVIGPGDGSLKMPTITAAGANFTMLGGLVAGAPSNPLSSATSAIAVDAGSATIAGGVVLGGDQGTGVGRAGDALVVVFNAGSVVIRGGTLIGGAGTNFGETYGDALYANAYPGASLAITGGMFIAGASGLAALLAPQGPSVYTISGGTFVGRIAIRLALSGTVQFLGSDFSYDDSILAGTLLDGSHLSATLDLSGVDGPYITPTSAIFKAAPLPEPASVMLLGLGLAAVLVLARRPAA